ncbi:MAG: hypothetical protein R3D67_04805 [Hyphomicrobiaceae bacterium]
MDWPLFDERDVFEDVEARLAAEALGDGLPLVAPTKARMAAMLAGVAEPDAGLGMGFVAPLFGELTPRTVAYNCVLAGCRPGERVVVEAAMVACQADELNLLGLMTTTGSAAIATVVHGPIAKALGLNSEINCLGPGNRANATIGRAISLCLRNIGGAREGSGDMATVGQPGKYTFCFADGAAADIPPLHVRRGFAAEASCVTVLGLSGTAEVLPLRDGEGGDAGADAILDALGIIMTASLETTGASRQPQPPEQVFILPPELATRLAANGFDLTAIQAYLYDWAKQKGFQIAAEPSRIQPIIAGGPGVKMAYLPLWGGGSCPVTREIAEQP